MKVSGERKFGATRTASIIITTGLAIILATWVAIKSPFFGVILGLIAVTVYLMTMRGDWDDKGKF
ncbi:MAG: hypothetical protein ACRBCS_04075 [Cellvibrionaceae bacterium]